MLPGARAASPRVQRPPPRRQPADSQPPPIRVPAPRVQVYDVTKFLEDHPGGPEIMMEHAGERARRW